MGLIGSALGRFVAGIEGEFGVALRPVTSSMTSLVGQLFLRGGPYPGGKLALNYPYIDHPIIQQVVGTIAEDLAQIEWEPYPAGSTVSDEEEESPLDGHPVLDWIASAGGMTIREVFEATTIYLLLDGIVYWSAENAIIQPANTPDSARLRGTPGPTIYPRNELVWRRERGRPDEVRERSTGRLVDPTKLVAFRRFNPYNPLDGASVIGPILGEARADLGASRWNEAAFADRNGVPSIILKPPLEKAPSATKRTEVKERFEEAHAYARRGVGVVPAGWDFEELGTSRRDMEYAGLRALSREMILAIGPLPPFLAGVLDKANYANSREQKQVYWRGTISRYLARYQDTINNKLLPVLGVRDVVLYPNWAAVRALADDVSQKTETAKTWFDLGLSKKVINEELEMGWDPDDVPDYEASYLPANYVPLAEVGSQFTSQPSTTGNDGDGADSEDPADTSMETTSQRADRRLSLWRLHVLRLRVLEKPTESTFRSHVLALQKEVEGKLKTNARLRIALVLGRDDPEGLRRASDDVETFLFDLNDAGRDLAKRFGPRIKVALVSGGEAVISDAGLEVTFDPKDPRLAARLLAQQLKVVGIDRTIRDALREAIQKVIDEGGSADDVAAAVQDVFDATRSRAATIARTEMGIAYSAGRTVGMLQAGIESHEWLSARDDKVRPHHKEEDGNVVAIGEPFPVTGLINPLDPDGPPEEIINCRCTTVPVIDRARARAAAGGRR